MDDNKTPGVRSSTDGGPSPIHAHPERWYADRLRASAPTYDQTALAVSPSNTVFGELGQGKTPAMLKYVTPATRNWPVVHLPQESEDQAGDYLDLFRRLSGARPKDGGDAA